jgi:cell division protein ZapE
MKRWPLARYEAMVAKGRIEADPAQAALAQRLDRLARALDGYRPGRRASAFRRLIGAKPPEPPRGLYIHGPVGRGKTLLMDLFFDAAPVEKKRRVHFHDFMADVHMRVHRWRQQRRIGEASGDEPIAPVAAALAADAWLLCFDEFAVRDIADAMILGRLFIALFAAGVVVVATSNVEPDGLYRDGLNRALFLPFIKLLGERNDVVTLDARADYRLQKLTRAPVYYCPADARAEKALDAAFLDMTGAKRGASVEIELLGRVLKVPQAIDGVARFSFDELCRRPLAAVDYLTLARHFHTLVVDRIPRLKADERDAARRFITLIDALYDLKVKMIASADAEPAELYQAAEGAEAFEFARCASRLIEMRSVDYLAEPHGVPSMRDLDGVVET